MRSEQSAQIAAIVLAAGLSSRMGRNKMLLEIEGQPLLRLIVSRALSAAFDPVVVVLGHQRRQNAPALSGLPCQIVDNPDYRKGMTSSLRVGVTALLTESDPPSAAVMLLADMPRVTSTMMMAVCRSYRRTRVSLVVSEYGDEAIHAPPTLFASSLFSDILALPDERCPRFLVKKHRAMAAVHKWPAACLHDLDRPIDLERLS